MEFSTVDTAVVFIDPQVDVFSWPCHMCAIYDTAMRFDASGCHNDSFGSCLRVALN